MASATQTAPAAPTTAKEIEPPAPVPVLSSEERLEKAELIVKSNMKWAAGAGAVPIPAVDLVGVGAFQLRMIKAISELYGVKFTEHAAKNIVSALIGTLGTRVLTVVAVGSMIKTLPFVGALIGGILVMPVIAGATTYAIGRVFVRHFEGGGTFADFSLEKAKGFFREKFTEGKKMSSESARAV